jgi:phosphoglycerate dehydrogenase-like enzyme
LTAARRWQKLAQPPHPATTPSSIQIMPRLLFAHRDFPYFAPKLQTAFPQLEVVTAVDLPAAEDKLADAEIIVSVDHTFNDARLAAAPKLRWIQTMTTGTDALERARTLRRDIVITNMRGIHGPQMSEMAFLYMLNLSRRFAQTLDNQRNHRWQRWDQVRLAGKTVLIVGTGLVAEALAPRCKAFGMTVLGVSRTPRTLPHFDRVEGYDAIKALAAQADFLVLIAPYSKVTHHLVNAELLNVMKKSACVLNLARGSLCDEAALIDALKTKRIAGAGLDVFNSEPLPADSPLWDMDNVIITPHVAGSSDDNLSLQWPIIEGNLRCFLDGRAGDMINRVTLKKHD